MNKGIEPRWGLYRKYHLMKIQDGVGQTRDKYFHTESVRIPQVAATGMLVHISRRK